MDDTSPSQASPGRRWRLARRLLLAFLILEVVYLLAANIFLRPEVGVPVVNRKPERFRLHWTGGWTVIPGVVHLRGLDMEVRAGRGSWHAEADRVRGRIALLDLARRCFRIAALEGSGLEFVAQLPPSATPGPGSYLPDQLEAESSHATGEEGLIPPSPPEAPPKTEGKNGWRIVLEGLDIDQVRQATFGPYSYRGDGRVTGGMSIQVRGGPLEVPGAQLRLEPGELTITGEHAAQLDLLAVELQMDPALRDERQGRESLKFMSGRIEVMAPEARLSSLNLLFRRIPSMDIAGRGNLRLEAWIDHGSLQAGTTFYSHGDSTVGYLDYDLRGVVEITGEVTDSADGEEGTLDLRFEEFELRQEGAKEAHVLGQGAYVQLKTTELQLADLEPDVRAVVEIPDSEVPRLAYYNRFLPPGSGAKILAGKGTFSAHMLLEAPAGTWSGKLSLLGKGVRLDLQGSLLEGDLNLEAVLPSGDIESRRADLSGTRLSIDRARFIPKGGTAAGKPWWARLDLPQGEVTLADPLGLEATFRAEIKDTSPLVALVGKDRKSPKWIRKLLTVENVTGSGKIRFQPQFVEARDLAFVAGEHIEVRGHLRLVKKDMAALLFCRYRKLSTSVEILDGERSWDLIGSRKWYQDREKGWLRKLGSAPPPPR